MTGQSGPRRIIVNISEAGGISEKASSEHFSVETSFFERVAKYSILVDGDVVVAIQDAAEKTGPMVSIGIYENV